MSPNSELSKYQGIYQDPKYQRYGHSNHGAKAAALVQELKPVSLVDVGCGWNEFVKEMQSDVPGPCVGVDFACPGADVIAEATALPFHAGEFDLLTSFDVLEHLTEAEVEPALREFSRVSRRFIFSIAYRPSKITWKGQNLHPCVKPREWWMERIQEAGAKVKRWQHYLTGEWSAR